MLIRILRGSLFGRRRLKLLSVVSVALGVAVATAVVSIALDIGDKISGELRSFGANIRITTAADSLAATVGGVDYRPAGTGAYLAESDLAEIKRIFWRNNIVAFAPFLSIPAEVRGRRAILTGSWFDKPLRVGKSEVFRTGLKQLHPAWKVDGQWPGEGNLGDVLVGRRLAQALGTAVGEVLTVKVAAMESGSETGNSGIAAHRAAGSLPASNLQFRVHGILETGGAEDDQIIAPLEAVQRLAGLAGKVRTVEVSALTKPEDAFARSDVTKLAPEQFDRWYCTPYVSSIAYQLQQAIPGSEARAVFEVAESEGKILGRVGLLMAILTLAALVTAALAVASMMFASVLERRVEIGLFKSLGATDARVAALFLLEGFALGLGGGVAGYAGGTYLAWRLSVAVFGFPASIHWLVFPAAVALALLVTLLGSALPLARGLKVSPAVVLRD